LLRDSPKLVDQIACDPFSAVILRDREIVDVNLASVLLELVQLVRGESADDFISAQRCKDDDVRLGECRLQVRVTRNGTLISISVVERLSKNVEELFEDFNVGR